MTLATQEQQGQLPPDEYFDTLDLSCVECGCFQNMELSEEGQCGLCGGGLKGFLVV